VVLSAEGASDLGERGVGELACEVHRDLARERDGLGAALGLQIRDLDSEEVADLSLDLLDRDDLLVFAPEIRQDFLGQVHNFARQFCPPNMASKAVGRIKRSVQSGAEVPFESGLAIERELQQQLFESPDAKEGLDAYVSKRKPEFRGW